MADADAIAQRDGLGDGNSVAEQLIAACVPMGAPCDPTIVALQIREWFATRHRDEPLPPPEPRPYLPHGFTDAARFRISRLIDRGFVARGVAFYGRNETACIVVCPDGSRRDCLPLDATTPMKESHS